MMYRNAKHPATRRRIGSCRGCVVVEQALFAAGDVYIDDPYQDCKFRYEHETDKVFVRPYGSRRENEIERINSYWGEAKSVGKVITKEEHFRD